METKDMQTKWPAISTICRYSTTIILVLLTLLLCWSFKGNFYDYFLTVIFQRLRAIAGVCLQTRLNNWRSANWWKISMWRLTHIKQSLIYQKNINLFIIIFICSNHLKENFKFCGEDLKYVGSQICCTSKTRRKTSTFARSLHVIHATNLKIFGVQIYPPS